MSLGDFAAQIASNVLFPAASLFSPRAAGEADANLKVYANPLGQNVLYRANTLDKMVLWEQWKMKDYQGLTIRPGDVVIDLGGHIGSSTLNYSHYVGKDGVVYSIEALPENFSLLTRNISRNGITNVKAFNLAIVGDRNMRRIQLNHNTHNSGGHSILDLGAVQQAATLCEAMTLEAFAEQQGITRIDILQMDIEGAEFEILLNADKAFLGAIPQIMFEYHNALGSGHDHRELLELLHGLGFQTREYVNFIAKVFRLNTGIIYAWK